MNCINNSKFDDVWIYLKNDVKDQFCRNQEVPAALNMLIVSFLLFCLFAYRRGDSFEECSCLRAAGYPVKVIFFLLHPKKTVFPIIILVFGR